MARSKTKRVSSVSPFKVSDYLDSNRLRAEYLAAWLDQPSSDTSDIVRALRDISHSRGFATIATKLGISRKSLERTLGKDGNPTLETFLKVTRACGIRLAAQSVNRSRERP